MPGAGAANKAAGDGDFSNKHSKGGANLKQSPRRGTPSPMSNVPAGEGGATAGGKNSGNSHPRGRKGMSY